MFIRFSFFKFQVPLSSDTKGGEFVHCCSVLGMFIFVKMSVLGGWGLVSTVVEPWFCGGFIFYKHSFTITVHKTFLRLFHQRTHENHHQQ